MLAKLSIKCSVHQSPNFGHT